MPDAPPKFTALAPPPGAKPPPNKDDEVIETRSLRDYYIILRERLWIALPLALTVAIGLAYWQSRETPQYRSAATLRFEKPTSITPGIKAVSSIEAQTDAEINTYIRIISSDTMRNFVFASLSPDEQKVLQRPYVKELPPGAAPPPAASLMGSLSVQSSHTNYIIEISVTHRDPEAAALLANRYVTQFINSLREEKTGSDTTAGVFLKDRAAELLQKSKASDERLQQYMRDQHLVSLEQSTNIVESRLVAADGALGRAHLERLAVEDQLSLVERYQADHRDLMEISFIAGYGSVSDLRRQRDGLLRDQALLAERYYENHPKMITSVNAIAVVQQQLDAAIQLAIADLKTNLEKVRANEKGYQQEYDKCEQDLLHLRDVAVEFKSLKEQADADRANYAGILTRQNDIQVVKSMEEVPVTPLDPAHPAGAPFTPDLNRITKTAIGVGVVVFFGIAFGLSFFDDRIKSTWDVETFINTTLLGIIPDLGGLKDDDKYRLVLGDNQGAGVEPFLALYSAVKIHSKLDFPKAILVTSTVPGEGKTLVSCNLAGSFARHGKRTLLIDCDLRRPMLHRHFNAGNEQGLISWYESGATLEGDLAAHPRLGITPIGDNLSLITSGGRSKSPTQFLESPAFARLIEQLKKQFDLIIIDSPPVGAVTDALLIAERADEVIYVCRFNRAFRKHIRLYIKALRSGKNEVLGVVLNGLSPRRIEYYSNYRYYRSYKKYYGAQS